MYISKVQQRVLIKPIIMYSGSLNDGHSQSGSVAFCREGIQSYKLLSYTQILQCALVVISACLTQQILS